LAAESLLFQVIGVRYETGSTSYPSNYESSKWVDFLGGKMVAAAIVDRIAHHFIVLNMNEPTSYRLTMR